MVMDEGKSHEVEQDFKAHGHGGVREDASIVSLCLQNLDKCTNSPPLVEVCCLAP